MIDIILDTFIDSLRMLPFLFASYLFIEYIEHRSLDKIVEKLKGYGVIGGSLLGCIPQCGFSVIASNLYVSKIITKGTLIAVLISTSDEAIPIFLSNPGNIGELLKIIAFKVFIALVAGFLMDAFSKQEKLSHKSLVSSHKHICNFHTHNIVKPAINHTFKVFIFITITTFILNLIIFLVGEDKLSILLLTNSIYQPVIAGLLGLIPNCASSIILSQLYLSNAISFGALIAGLSTGAGVGWIVLFKVNDTRDNIKILAYIYIISIISGMLIQFII